MKRKWIFPLSLTLLAGAAGWFLWQRRHSQAGERASSHSGLLSAIFPEDSGLPNQALYHYYAPLYDRLFSAPYLGARQRSVALLDLQPGEHLLISGVGTGLDLPLLRGGALVTGIDISAAMLRQASKKPSKAAVRLVEMDAQCLDFPAGSFDAVLLNLIVSVAPDGRAVFHEAWRVLKPGGRLVLFDKFAPDGAAISPLRLLLGSLFRIIGTDINRKLCDIIGELPDGTIEINEPSVFFGQYRILKFKKVEE